MATARTIKKFSQRQAEILTYIYQVRLTLLLTRRADANEVYELWEHLKWMINENRLKALRGLKIAYGDIWKSFKDIVEARLEALNSEAPGIVRKLEHVEEILQFIRRNNTVKREEILNEFPSLKTPHLDNLLEFMNKNDIIEHNKKTGEIKIGENGN